jgi:uncharacterized protein YeaO (DUF488 family)
MNEEFGSEGRGPFMKVILKRAYDPPAEGDGRRILMDRVWPRGVTKEALALDAWHKDAAPSADLRRWFGHDPENWKEFLTRYFDELDREPPGLREKMDLVERGPVTLVFGARDVERNNAAALKRNIEEKLGK